MNNSTNTDTKIQRNAIKGARVRKMDFETGIHALPVGIKNQIDQMIKQKYPPTEILRQLSQKYPNQYLSSKSALYNYRKKHYTESLASHRQLLQSENQLDVDKIKLKSVLIETPHSNSFVITLENALTISERYYRNRLYASTN